MNNWFSPTNPNSIPNQIANLPDIKSSGPNSQELVAILWPLCEWKPLYCVSRKWLPLA